MRFLLPAILAWAIAQVLKVCVISVRKRHLDLRVLAETGGMPSSHSSIVAALTTAVGRLNGVTSDVFAISLIFSIVVMYDAQGVRRAAGRQAAILNRLIDDLLARQGVQETRLR